MSIRKRVWTTARGIVKEAYVVDRRDMNGKRHSESFGTKEAAEQFDNEQTQVAINGNGSATPQSVNQVALSDDLLWGVEAIAREIGRTHRQTTHMVNNGHIPVKKIAGKWVSSRAALRKSFAPIQA